MTRPSDASKSGAETPAAYRPKQAAAQLGIGLATLYRRIKAGDIHVTKFGGATLIARSEIERVTNPAHAVIR